MRLAKGAIERSPGREPWVQNRSKINTALPKAGAEPSAKRQRLNDLLVSERLRFLKPTFQWCCGFASSLGRHRSHAKFIRPIRQ